MRGLVFRTLIVTHRWVGIALGLLILLWCLSGFVMMYVPYPEPEPASVRQGLQPLNKVRCCTLPGIQTLPDSVPIMGYGLQMLGGLPALRLDAAFGPSALLELGSGAAARIDSSLALEVARRFAQANGIAAASPGVETIEQDQWTVYGSYHAHRPLYRIRLNDLADSVVYVSGTEGTVVQFTQTRQRFWNWLGAVPHWLYFEKLRQNQVWWDRTVIWSSAAGCLLTIFGLWLGIWQLRRNARGELASPYRGVRWWHHVPGLVFGVFVLTWALSGLFSMQPWGFLETHAGEDAALLQGEPPTWERLRPVLERLPQAQLPANTVSIEGAFFGGQIFSVATTRSGQRQRFDASWNPVSVSNAELATAAHTLSASSDAAESTPASWELLTGEDWYYYSHGDSTVSLPVIRMTMRDAPATRYYLDPVSGALLKKVDDNARGYRWLHLGLHRLDFPLLRERPTWDLLMWLLLGGATAVTATGVYMGFRRLARI